MFLTLLLFACSPATTTTTEVVAQEAGMPATPKDSALQMIHTFLQAQKNLDIEEMKKWVTNPADLAEMEQARDSLSKSQLQSLKEKNKNAYPPGKIEFYGFYHQGKRVDDIVKGTRAVFIIHHDKDVMDSNEQLVFTGDWRYNWKYQSQGLYTELPELNALKRYISAMVKGDRKAAQEAALPGADLSGFTLGPKRYALTNTLKTDLLWFDAAVPEEQALLLTGELVTPGPNEVVFILHSTVYDLHGAFRVREINKKWYVDPFDVVPWCAKILHLPSDP